MTPFVTVLIPAYDAAATIRRAIDSALAQNYPACEILVVDDGSRDATSEIVAGYRQPEIRLLRLPANRGEGGVLNEGIRVATGDYVAFLDADDEWLPGKLAKQIDVLERNPKATIATCGCRFVDAAGRTVELFGISPPGLAKGEIWRSLLAATCIAKPCVVARGAALAQVGPFDETVPIGADQDMWIRLAMAGEVEFVPEYLTIAHDTPGSLTKKYVRETERAVLPMVRRYLERRGNDLTREEVRRILCERYTTVGRNLYTHGKAWRGLRLILRSLGAGASPSEALWYLAVASPPARAAKRLFRSNGKSARARPSRPPGPRLLAPADEDLAMVPEGPPILIVTVDAEAEFDWRGPFLRTHLGVKNLGNQGLAQQLFDRFGVKPTYFVDYAVALQPEGYEPLRHFADAGRCEIGAHLQSWETPPFEEELGEQTSYNHNLPAWLQKEKLSRLTEMIVAKLGVHPLSYKAGRYGIGEEIGWILAALGYQIEMSVLPGIDMRRRHGPDFRQAPERPYWFGPDWSLLEIPMSAGFVGLLGSPGLPKAFGPGLYDLLSRPSPLRAHAPGLFARLGLLERIVLTPEGMSYDDLRRLTRALLSRNRRVLVFTYHSSSLLPGSTDYVRSAADLSRFLGTIEAYLEFFFSEIGGVAMTPTEFRAALVGGARRVAAAEERVVTAAPG